MVYTPLPVQQPSDSPGTAWSSAVRINQADFNTRISAAAAAITALENAPAGGVRDLGAYDQLSNDERTSVNRGDMVASTHGNVQNQLWLCWSPALARTPRGPGEASSGWRPISGAIHAASTQPQRFEVGDVVTTGTVAYFVVLAGTYTLAQLAEPGGSAAVQMGGDSGSGDDQVARAAAAAAQATANDADTLANAAGTAAMNALQAAASAQADADTNTAAIAAIPPAPVSRIVGGSNVTVSPPTGVGEVTISASDSGGGGDITGVTAGGGLSGGGDSGDVTLQLDNNLPDGGAALVDGDDMNNIPVWNLDAGEWQGLTPQVIAAQVRRTQWTNSGSVSIRPSVISVQEGLSGLTLDDLGDNTGESGRLSLNTESEAFQDGVGAMAGENITYDDVTGMLNVAGGSGVAGQFFPWYDDNLDKWLLRRLDAFEGGVEVPSFLNSAKTGTTLSTGSAYQLTDQEAGYVTDTLARAPDGDGYNPFGSDAVQLPTYADNDRLPIWQPASDGRPRYAPWSGVRQNLIPNILNAAGETVHNTPRSLQFGGPAVTATDPDGDGDVVVTVGNRIVAVADQAAAEAMPSDDNILYVWPA